MLYQHVVHTVRFMQSNVDGETRLRVEKLIIEEHAEAAAWGQTVNCNVLSELSFPPKFECLCSEVFIQIRDNSKLKISQVRVAAVL